MNIKIKSLGVCSDPYWVLETSKSTKDPLNEIALHFWMITESRWYRKVVSLGSPEAAVRPFPNFETRSCASWFIAPMVSIATAQKSCDRQISWYLVTLKLAALSAAAPACSSAWFSQVRRGQSVWDSHIPRKTSTLAALVPWDKSTPIRSFPIRSKQARGFFDGWNTSFRESSVNHIIQQSMPG